MQEMSGNTLKSGHHSHGHSCFKNTRTCITTSHLGNWILNEQNCMLEINFFCCFVLFDLPTFGNIAR